MHEPFFIRIIEIFRYVGNGTTDIIFYVLENNQRILYMNTRKDNIMKNVSCSLYWKNFVKEMKLLNLRLMFLDSFIHDIFFHFRGTGSRLFQCSKILQIIIFYR